MPSSLLLGATTYITTDIAAVPLLWVLPLAIYLLSFILAFGRWPARLHRAVRRGHAARWSSLAIFLMISALPDAHLGDGALAPRACSRGRRSPATASSPSTARRPGT